VSCEAARKCAAEGSAVGQSAVSLSLSTCIMCTKHWATRGAIDCGFVGRVIER
jgi:hypothetical protein